VEQTGLAHAHVTDDDVLEDVVVIVRRCSHVGTYKKQPKQLLISYRLLAGISHIFQ